MNAPPDTCGFCNADMTIEEDPTWVNPYWDTERDGPQYPNGHHRWHTITVGWSFEDDGLCKLRCPDCFETADYQAWGPE